jgi:hypothetical protein
VTAAYLAYLKYKHADPRTREGRRVRAENEWAFRIAKQRGACHEVLELLQALRRPCFDPEHEQFFEDAEAFEDTEVDDLKRWLETCGRTPAQRGDWFNAARNHELVCTYDGYFVKQEDTWCCDYSEGTFSQHAESYEVQISRHSSETWCEDAKDEHAFYCEVSDKFYCHRNYGEGKTVGGLIICTDIASEYEYYWSERYEAYSNDPDDYRDEDEHEYDGIPSYHCAERLWDYKIPNRSSRAFYGFELELNFSASGRCWKEMFSSREQNMHFCAEADSSLQDDFGMEVISRPFSIDELRADDNQLKTKLKQLRPYILDDGDEDYGVHITTNWQRLTEDHRRRLVDFVFDTKSMTIFVARRENKKYAPFEDKYDLVHHCALHRRDNGSVEFRIFRSTYDWDMLMSYVDYIEAATEWTRLPYRGTHGPMVQSLFRAWVRSQPEVYPYLSKRLPILTSKDIKQCVSQLSSPPVESSRKKLSASASTTTATAQASQSGTGTVTWYMPQWESVDPFTMSA